ncbi:hypothetical protein PR048_003947 [Dryococelus australis]|uniref:DNA-directed DNA polymerase n=1 Tax=Dryococelus australis TaxID=614101 RepID=A0ABQ9I443_9NEOP|nr:hypothetical protein PR048_003947 [Dryococelus australis]
MSQYLPYGGFKWRNTYIDVRKIRDDARKGYILEVDLEYPRELHDLHKDVPLAPENRIPENSKMPKLLNTLYDKERYVLHYVNLKQYLSLGMKLKKIHRVLEFDQSDWLKSYIDLNTNMRTKASNDFEKDFYKLMNNSVFGKTMENIRNRVDIRLCTSSMQVDKLVAKPNFKDRTIFTDSLVAVHMHKTNLYFNKPIYVGMSILDLSKTLMYDFHYNLMKPKYGKNIELCYQDTDSYIYCIKTSDFYSDMKEMIDHFDTYDYKKDNPYGLPLVNKKIIGKMKDECIGKILEELIGLKSKMYAINVEGDVKKIAKGVKNTVVRNEISFDDYKNCLFGKEVVYKSMNLIKSKKHELFSIELRKKALSPEDDKRYILKDGINTLPWGHYKIEKRARL